MDSLSRASLRSSKCARASLTHWPRRGTPVLYLLDTCAAISTPTFRQRSWASLWRVWHWGGWVDNSWRKCSCHSLPCFTSTRMRSSPQYPSRWRLSESPSCTLSLVSLPQSTQRSLIRCPSHCDWFGHWVRFTLCSNQLSGCCIDLRTSFSDPSCAVHQ